MVEIGAGGGSIGSVDALNRIAVGPESAGADPGPAIYGKGGVKATVTDADFVLGKISPEYFAGGKLDLDESAGAKVIEGAIGAATSLNSTEAAFGLTEIVDENMASAARAHAVEQGRDIRQFTMAAFGGAAPLHAARLADKIGIDKIVIPRGAGVGSAIGFLLARASFEIVRSFPVVLNQINSDLVISMFDDMRREAKGVVMAASPNATVVETRVAYMRYRGQGYEIPVSLHGETIVVSKLEAAFLAAYQKLYGRVIPGMEIEILTWSLKLEGPASSDIANQEFKAKAATVKNSRSVYDPEQRKKIEYSVVERETLQPGDHVEGPALIVEDQTTTVVTAAFDCGISELGDILLVRRNINGR